MLKTMNGVNRVLLRRAGNSCRQYWIGCSKGAGGGQQLRVFFVVLYYKQPVSVILRTIPG